MSFGEKVAKNAIWLMVATTGQKAIAFLTFTLVARLVGVETTGAFFYAVSVTSVFVTFGDLGLTPVLIREMAGNEERGRQLLARVLHAKALLIPIAIALSLTYAWVMQSDPKILVAVALACFVMTADALSLVWYGAIRGRRELRYEAFGMLMGQILGAGVTLLAVAFHTGINGLIGGLFAGSLWNALWSLSRVKKLNIGPLKSSIPWRTLIRAALPFALAGIFVKVYSYIDTLLLKEFYSETQVGYYAVAYKVTYALQFLPLTFVAALYPSMSAAYASKEKSALESMLVGSLRLMMVIAAPLAAALSSFAVVFIPLVYGNAYVGSVAPLTILSWVLIPIFLDFPVGSLLNATHRAGKKTTAMGMVMVINAIANILLIPRLGPVGAAISAVISFSILFLLGLYFIRKDLSHPWNIAGIFARGAIVAIGLRLLIPWLLLHGSFWMAAPLSILAAGILIVATGLVSLEDARQIGRWIKRPSSATVAKETHEE